MCSRYNCVNLFRTTKREQTFYDGAPGSPKGVCHIPMAEPFCLYMREVSPTAPVLLDLPETVY